MPKNKLGPKGQRPNRVLPQKKASFETFNKHRFRIVFPSKYRKAAVALRDVVKYNMNLDSIILQKTYAGREAYQLALIAIRHKNEIDYLLSEFQIIEENQSLNHWELATLVAEVIWGKQHLKSGAATVEAIKYYEESLREACLKMLTFFPRSLDNLIPILPIYVRINKLKVSIEVAIQSFVNEGWQLLPWCNKYSEYLNMVGSLRNPQRYFIRDFHIPELLVFPPGTSFYNHPGYLNGQLLLQDKGSCLSTFLLNPNTGSTVLDLCAAPGLKTNHLANLMNNNGLLYANDIHPERFAALSRLLDLTNVHCAQLIHSNIFDMQIPQVDYILVDPSCTYSGIFSKTKNNCQGDRLKRSYNSLNSILRYALQSFPNVKKVVYTTCSIFPSEGEKVVDDALKEIGDSYTLLDLKELLGNQWVNLGFSTFVVNTGFTAKYACGSKCLRTIPEYDKCQGYFIAIFERNFKVPVPSYVQRKKNHKHNRTDIDVLNNLTNAKTCDLSGIKASNDNVLPTLTFKKNMKKNHTEIRYYQIASCKKSKFNNLIDKGTENLLQSKQETSFSQQFTPDFFKLY